MDSIIPTTSPIAQPVRQCSVAEMAVRFRLGTVTTGKMSLVEIVAAPGVERDDALRLVGAVENASEHPIARAIARAAATRGALPTVERFASRDGLGVEGLVEGRR